MNFSVESLRSDFYVLVVESQAPVLRNYVTLLEHAGYQVESYAGAVDDLNALLEKVRQSPPHVILFGSKNIDKEEPALRALQQLSSEIQIIVMVNKGGLPQALALMEKQKVSDCLSLPLSSPLELILRVDQVALKLYYQYENEHLRTSQTLQAAQQNAMKSAPTTPPLKPPTALSFDSKETEKAEAAVLLSIEQSFDRFAFSRDPGQTLQAFLQMGSDICYGRPFGYFKFLPSHFSFVFSHGVNFPVLDDKNLGVDLRSSGLREPSELFAQLAHLPEIKAMFEQVFQTTQYEVFAHFSENEGLGFFVLLGAVGQREIRKLSVLAKIFSLHYDKNVLQRQRASFEVRDPLTSLYSLSYFEQKLKEEISRARRLGLPLALVGLRLDRLEDLQKEIGLANSDTILKMVAVLLKKTSRVNDLVAAYDRGRILLLLPHTDHKGAEIKADRLRTMIGTARFPLAESQGWGAIKVSLGVCDYPNLCEDGESLVRRVLESLHQAQADGGDRVVVASPTPGFKADFTPQNLSPITNFLAKDRSGD